MELKFLLILIIIIIIRFTIIKFIIRLYIINNNIIIFIKITLINLISFNISVDIIIDWISTIFITIVILISRIIILFSIYYIPKNDQKKFNILLIIFILSIILLIIRNNIFIILLGWDGLGLSSYILVIFYQNYLTRARGSITFITNRIGDIIILISIRLIIINNNWNLYNNIELNKISILIFTIAACSKRAQFPFSAWLPIAIAAPTPISALVHSSTLVTAGVYLILRLINYNYTITILLLIITSRFTAIYSRISACWEKDLKKIIALSTLRQIAIIIFAISINFIILTFIHLIIHALFKSTIFICAGIIIHEYNYQDIRIIRINHNITPIIISTITISNIALIGIPFTSGFFSKDLIIENLILIKIESLLSSIILLSIGLTASYSIRILYHSNKNIIKSQSKTSNKISLTKNIPLIIITLLSIFSGSTLSWILNPEQILIIPSIYKYYIILIILIRSIFRLILKFNKKTFIKLRERILSLWFSHNLFSYTKPITNTPIKIIFNNDKQWQENYGPKNSFKLIIKFSSNLIKSLKLPIIITIIIIILILINYLS